MSMENSLVSETQSVFIHVIKASIVLVWVRNIIFKSLYVEPLFKFRNVRGLQ